MTKDALDIFKNLYTEDLESVRIHTFVQHV